MKLKFWRKDPSWPEVIDQVKLSMYREAMRLEKRREEKGEQFRGV